MRKMLGSGRRPAEIIDHASASSSESIGGSTEEEDDDDQPLREEETWVEWIRRTTGIVEKQLRATSLDDWVAAQRKRKWSFAGHVARRDDGRCSHQVLKWEPPEGCRSRGHPVKWWGDALDEFFKSLGIGRHGWITIAQDRQGWALLAKDFAYF